MSSFSDTFTRDENKDTQYDDSAFYSFAGTILLVFIVILIYFIFKRIFYSKKLKNTKVYKNCECKNCEERVNKHYARVQKKNFNFTFYLMIFLVIFFSYLFYLSYFEIVRHGNNFKRFDPYEILEIDPSAELKDIKKAYRRMTLKFHPDKNPNNLQAKAKFIMIAKAYESLTDELARKNFELYGNPDGPGSMRLAVGLPSFVLNKKNHMPILILFLVFIMVVIPSFVWFWFSNSNKYDDSGVLVNDGKIFYELINENTLMRQMPYILGYAIEYNSLKVTRDQAEELEKLWKRYKEQMPKHKEEMIPFPNRKAIALIYAYLHDHTFTSPGLNEDMEFILKTAPNLINNMYTMAIQCTQFNTINKNVKFFGYLCVKTIIEFSQLLHQKLPMTKDCSPFLQLPHFTDAKYKNIKRPKKGEELRLTTLPNFLALTPEERQTLIKSEFTPEEIADVEKACEAFPRYSLTVEAFVEGFEEILFEDLITIKVTVDRLNMDTEREVGVTHSLNFPELFHEKAFVLLSILGDKGIKRIVYEVMLDIEKKTTTHEFKHMAREVGEFKFEAELLPFNYKGLDVSSLFTIQVKKSSEKRTEFIKSIEKREGKQKLEPSMFQKMLSEVFPINEDEEEEEEDDEENKEGEDKEEQNADEQREDNHVHGEHCNHNGETNLIDEPQPAQPEQNSRGVKRRKQKQD